MYLSTSVSPAWKSLGLREEEYLVSLRECGFSLLCDEISGALPAGDAFEQGKNRKEFLQSVGMKAVKLRLSGRYAVEDAARAIVYCSALGADRMVLPFLFDNGWGRQEYLNQNGAYLRALTFAAKENGVTVLLEHAGGNTLPHYTHTSQELLTLLDESRAGDCFAVNINVGAIGLTDFPLYPEIRLCGDRVRGLDASDNFFGMPLAFEPERENLGFAPLMGFLDYDEVMLALKEAGYCGEFNLHLNYPRIFPKSSPYIREAKLNMLPEDLLKQFTVWARHSSEYILESYDCLDGKEAQI